MCGRPGGRRLRPGAAVGRRGAGPGLGHRGGVSVAQRGKVIDEATRRQIVRLSEVLSVRAVAREAGVSPNTVQKYKPTGKGPRTSGLSDVSLCCLIHEQEELG